MAQVYSAYLYYHKDADKNLHKISQNQVFVSVRRVPPKLPQIKELMMPVMTEIINEEDPVSEQQVFQDLLSYSVDQEKVAQLKKLQESVNQSIKSSGHDNFQYRNPMSIKESDLILVNSRQGSLVELQARSIKGSQRVTPTAKALKDIQRENAEKYIRNPNLAVLVDRIEQRHSKLSKRTAARTKDMQERENSRERTRKFKKPMDTMGQRQLRLEMVKGMSQIDSGVVNQKKAEKPIKSVFQSQEETDSSLTHKEIDEIAEKFRLSWQQVFQLDAEFWSLITIQEEEKNKREGNNDSNNFFGPEENNRGGPSRANNDDDDQDGGGASKDAAPSVSLKIFMEFTTSLADKFKDVIKRMIQAFGIDTTSEAVRIQWDQFLSLKCFLQLFTLKEEELQSIWMKALDPRGLSFVPVSQFKNFIERLSRGSMSDTPTPVSRVFTDQLMEMLEIEQCFSDNKDQIDMNKLRQKIEEEQCISIEVFNQLLKQDCEYKVVSGNYSPDG